MARNATPITQSRDEALRPKLPLRPAATYQPERLKTLRTIFDLLLVLGIASWFCFTNLDTPSLGMGDETIYVRAAQGMERTGDYSTPLVDDSAFFGKPPLRMWLTPLATTVLGDSSASVRTPDAIAGLILAVGIYFFAFSLFGSRGLSLTAVLLLFGSQAYVLNHGPRMAVLDSLLITLFFGVMVAAWKVCGLLGERLPDGATLKRWSILGGLLLGAAILTKSGAGIVPVLPILFYCVLSGLLPKLLGRGVLAIAIVAACSLLVASPYFLYHCVFTPGACQNLIGLEVIERAVSGFHNTNMPEFYLIRIFQDGAYLPPLLLVLALGLSTAITVVNRDKRHLFLLCWFVVPLVFYSSMQSRLTWYVSPAIPAAAILSAFFLWSLWRIIATQLKDWAAGRAESLTAAYTAGSFLLVTSLLAASHIQSVAQAVMTLDARLPIDSFAHSVIEGDPDFTQTILHVAGNTPAWDERAYMHMLGSRVKQVNAIEDIRPQLSAPGFVGYAVTDIQQGETLLQSTPVTHYGFAPPHYDRKRWLMFLGYGSLPTPPLFQSIPERVSFGTETFKSLSGWEAPGAFDGTPVRRMLGGHASFLVAGDPIRSRLGTTFAVKLGFIASEQSGRRADIDVFLNQRFLATISPKPNDFSVHTFAAKPGMWNGENNVLSFVATYPEATSQEPLSPLLFEWLYIRPLNTRD